MMCKALGRCVEDAMRVFCFVSREVHMQVFVHDLKGLIAATEVETVAVLSRAGFSLC